MMMKKEHNTKKKYQKPAATRDGQKRGSYIANKPYKNKIETIEDDVFKIGSVKNVAQFTWSLLNVADYVQMKYNDEVGEVIWMLMLPQFDYPMMPIEKNKKTKKEMR